MTQGAVKFSRWSQSLRIPHKSFWGSCQKESQSHLLALRRSTTTSGYKALRDHHETTYRLIKWSSCVSSLFYFHRAITDWRVMYISIWALSFLSLRKIVWLLLSNRVLEGSGVINNVYSLLLDWKTLERDHIKHAKCLGVKILTFFFWGWIISFL